MNNKIRWPFGADEEAGGKYELGYAVVDELPETIADGALVLYNGTLWRGLLAGESSLPAGTPWPVKGYKEYVVKLSQLGTDPPTANIISSDVGEPVISRLGEGQYLIGIPQTLGRIYGMVNYTVNTLNDAMFFITILQQVGDVLISVFNTDFEYLEDNILLETPFELKLYPPAP
jgi:hypothetical protein